jgi:lysozyme family protein
MIILGDSIAVGLSAEFPGAERFALVGISTRAIAAMIPAQFPVGVTVILSAGSNDLRDSPALEAALRALRSGIPPELPVIWILPSNEARPAVERVAEVRGDTTVAFIPGPDGIHPRSYRALADDVREALPPETPMRDSFPRALQLVLAHEGGFVDHPKDPGGATNKGITLSTYRGYTRNNRLTAADLRNITDEMVARIYRERYWNAVKGDQLPNGVDYAVFDFAVNSGPARAAKFLQKVVGTKQDGVIGPMTLDAVAGIGPSVINRLCEARLFWLRKLPTWPTFGRGWERRVRDVEREARKMGGAAPVPVPAPPVPFNERPPDPEDATRGDPAPTPSPVTKTDAVAGGGFLAAIGAAVATGAKWVVIAALVAGAAYLVIRMINDRRTS